MDLTFFPLFYLSPLYQNSTLALLSPTTLSPMFWIECKGTSCPSVLAEALVQKPNYLLLPKRWQAYLIMWRVNTFLKKKAIFSLLKEPPDNDFLIESFYLNFTPAARFLLLELWVLRIQTSKWQVTPQTVYRVKTTLSAFWLLFPFYQNERHKNSCNSPKNCL